MLCLPLDVIMCVMSRCIVQISLFQRKKQRHEIINFLLPSTWTERTLCDLFLTCFLCEQLIKRGQYTMPSPYWDDVSEVQSWKMLQHALQDTAAHCSTLQHTTAHCNTLQHTATHCNTRCRRHIGMVFLRSKICHTLQDTMQHNATPRNSHATQCNTPQLTCPFRMLGWCFWCAIFATCCNTHCITLQHFATHCNTL